MAKKEKYRLEAMLKLKLRQKRTSEIALAKAIKKLEEEKNKREKLLALKKEIEAKREGARGKMREKVLSGNSRIQDSQFHLGFMEKLKEDNERMDAEIKEQDEVIERAAEKLKRARRDYMDAASELNIMEKHKELWQKKVNDRLTALEDKQMNELGNTVFQMNKMRG